MSKHEDNSAGSEKARRLASALKDRSPFKDWPRVDYQVRFSDKTWPVAEVRFFVKETNWLAPAGSQQPFMIVHLNVETGHIKDCDPTYIRRPSTPAERSLNMHDFVSALGDFKVLLMREKALGEVALQISGEKLIEPLWAAIRLKERSPFKDWPEVDTTVPVYTQTTWPMVEFSFYVKDVKNPTTLICPLCVVRIDVKTNLVKQAQMAVHHREPTAAEKLLDSERFRGALGAFDEFIREELRKGQAASPPNKSGPSGLDPC